MDQYWTSPSIARWINSPKLALAEYRVMLSTMVVCMRIGWESSQEKVGLIYVPCE